MASQEKQLQALKTVLLSNIVEQGKLIDRVIGTVTHGSNALAASHVIPERIKAIDAMQSMTAQHLNVMKEILALCANPHPGMVSILHDAETVSQEREDLLRVYKQLLQTKLLIANLTLTPE